MQKPLKYNINEDGYIVEIGYEDYSILFTNEPFTIMDSHLWRLVDGEWILITEIE